MTTIKVNKLPSDPGPAAWNSILEDRTISAELAERRTADWLIIGAGFAGLAAARRLRELHPTDQIVLLDASTIADGPAGRNSGFMIDLPHDLSSDDYGGAPDADRLQTQVNRAAIAFAENTARDFGLTEEALVVSGKINAAATKKGLKHNSDYAAHLTTMHESHELLDAAQMKSVTGIDYYKGGLFTPGTAMLQPALYIRGIADGVVMMGVSLYEKSPVVSLQLAGSDWIAKTPLGAVTSPRVILAVNGHAESFGFYTRKLMHVFTYGSMTRQLTKDEVNRLGGEARWGMTPADPMGTTVRRISGIGGDRLIVRNRFTYDPSMEVTKSRLEKVARSHDQAFKARFINHCAIPMEYTWGGRLCISRNNVQAVEEVKPGLFTAVCQNGLGAAKGTLGGMVAAELASGQYSDLVQQVTGQGDPTSLPPEPIAWLGANAVLRWDEFRAGREL